MKYLVFALGACLCSIGFGQSPIPITYYVQSSAMVPPVVVVSSGNGNGDSNRQHIVDLLQMHDRHIGDQLEGIRDRLDELQLPTSPPVAGIPGQQPFFIQPSPFRCLQPFRNIWRAKAIARGWQPPVYVAGY